MLENDPIQLDEAANDEAPSTALTRAAKSRPSIDRVTFCVGVLVAVAAGGLYAMHHRTSAGMERVAQADVGATGIDTLLSGGREGISALTRSVRSTRDLVTRITHRNVEPDTRLASAHFGDGATPRERDPFRSDLLEQAAIAPPSMPAAVNVDDAVAREQAKAVALAAARQLQLQSIIHGSSRRACLINGRLYFEGQTVDTFTIASIAPDAVVLRSGEFRFELRLRK